MGQKTRTMGLPDGQKSYKIGLTILIQYWCVTDRHPASQPRCRGRDRAYVYVAAYIYVARVKIRNLRKSQNAGLFLNFCLMPTVSTLVQLSSVKQ